VIYISHLAILLSVYTIIALSLNVIAGYCGRLALSQAAFFGIGAYVYALASLRSGLGFLPAVTAAVATAAVLSVVISVPAARLRQDFFIILSLAVQALVFGVLYNWSREGVPPGTWANLTNGPFGLVGIPKPSIGNWSFETVPALAIFSVAWLILIAICCWRLTSSPWGRLLKAVRDDSEVAAGMGKNVRATEITAFAIGCGLAAVAGALYAGYSSYLDPTVASLDHSILMLSMVIVGGAGNSVGPFVGAAILILVPEAVRFLNVPSSLAANLRLMAYGAMLVFFMHCRPQGLAGEYRLE
jgi:branched-chain amino acid transport system permease protein